MAQTICFATIALSQILHAWTSRRETGPLRLRDLLSNIYMVGSLVITVALQMATIYLPALQSVLKTYPLGAYELAVVCGFALIPLVVGQVLRRIVAWSRTD
jgi:Ca2+-transporting ATPase